MKDRQTTDFDRNTKILELEIRIRKAKILTIASCGLFAPCTCPYISRQKSKLANLRRQQESTSAVEEPALKAAP